MESAVGSWYSCNAQWNRQEHCVVLVDAQRCCDSSLEDHEVLGGSPMPSSTHQLRFSGDGGAGYLTILVILRRGGGLAEHSAGY